MLKTLRHKKVAKKILITLAAIIIPAFVLWGSGSIIRSNKGPNYAGLLFGRKISFEKYNDSLVACKNQAIIQFGDNFYEIQKYMTLSRHVYSYHIDVASLKWWQTLDSKTRDMVQKAMHEAAVFQRKQNRDKDAARLKFLKEKGMQVVENPDIAAFRAKVANLKDMDLYSDTKVKAMLIKMLKATK